MPKEGQVYGKNLVDVVVKDSAGKIVDRYQAKYGKTAEDTIKNHFRRKTYGKRKEIFRGNGI